MSNSAASVKWMTGTRCDFTGVLEKVVEGGGVTGHECLSVDLKWIVFVWLSCPFSLAVGAHDCASHMLWC